MRKFRPAWKHVVAYFIMEVGLYEGPALMDARHHTLSFAIRPPWGIPNVDDVTMCAHEQTMCAKCPWRLEKQDNIENKLQLQRSMVWNVGW